MVKKNIFVQLKDSIRRFMLSIVLGFTSFGLYMYTLRSHPQKSVLGKIPNMAAGFLLSFISYAALILTMAYCILVLIKLLDIFANKHCKNTQDNS